ncbi:M56 family metallopeptidase [Anaerocolumna sp. MB42-C2]|uniref:M56 family metallopeptidase n=1 Tax=Anaerocolumna sp. MB42-C2 TaxID=3070997 RepID=UPI0027E05EF5|nr:M56 family metallopeptidase [Anaerocolumna sp. MB42-C2]WMJ85536.1 M56 family metallopeptidase [Anaerocolumna sp. MB42-C2]
MDLIYTLFYKIVQLSFMGSFIVACILLCKKIIREKIGVKFQYAIWFILILRLILPVSPSSILSLYNYVPPYENTMMNIPVAYQSNEDNIAYGKHNTIQGSNKVIPNVNVSPVSLKKTELKPVKSMVPVKKILPFIWISGFLIIGSVIFINNTLFYKHIMKYDHIKDPDVIAILDDCKGLMKLSQNICLVKTNIIKTPCVLNFIKPIILLPDYSIEKDNIPDLKYILLHELAHVKRNDIFINYIISLLCIIYWFNPLIWYGFHRMREDRELCCDSLALSVLREDEVKDYGFSIIKIAEMSLWAPCLPAVAGIINKNSKMKRRIEMIKVFKKNSYRLSAFALAVLLLAGFAFLTEATESKASSTEEVPSLTEENSTQRIEDKIDYPFVDDKDAVGKWETVDFVADIDDFNVNKTSWQGGPYLLSINLLPDGQMTQPVVVGETSDETTPVNWLTWTKGYIIHHGDKTAGKYVIKDIDGSQYMFWEWKSGDYTIRGMKPKYYVFKKVPAGSTEEIVNFKENITSQRIEDKIDYPFVDDKEAVGKWETVDFIADIDDFNVNQTSWQGDPYLLSINLLPDGQMTQPVAVGETSDETTPVNWLTWTKGYIIHHGDKTAGKYVIKEIDGSQYMFWEWKSGDYTIRGMKPYYYVFKKAN